MEREQQEKKHSRDEEEKEEDGYWRVVRTCITPRDGNVLCKSVVGLRPIWESWEEKRPKIEVVEATDMQLTYQEKGRGLVCRTLPHSEYWCTSFYFTGADYVLLGGSADIAVLHTLDGWVFSSVAPEKLLQVTTSTQVGIEICARTLEELLFLAAKQK